MVSLECQAATGTASEYSAPRVNCPGHRDALHNFKLNSARRASYVSVHTCSWALIVFFPYNSILVPEEGFLLGCVFAIADYPEQMSDKQLLATWKRVRLCLGEASFAPEGAPSPASFLWPPSLSAPAVLPVCFGLCHSHSRLGQVTFWASACLAVRGVLAFSLLGSFHLWDPEGQTSSVTGGVGRRSGFGDMG